MGDCQPCVSQNNTDLVLKLVIQNQISATAQACATCQCSCAACWGERTQSLIDRPQASRLSPALRQISLTRSCAGEAAADALKLEPGQVCGFVSTTREMLSRFVMTHLPVQYDAGPNSSMPGICCSCAALVVWCS